MKAEHIKTKKVCTYNYKDAYSCHIMKLDSNETCIYCGANI
jgi:hypothetical protein